MTENRVKRKLSAILSADVVGYSRLMGEDEVSTVRTLEAYRKVMADLIEQFRGRVVDSPGDNLLAEFSSVVDAVQCGVEIHEVIRAKNEELPEDRRMLLRIGVNLGDVIQEGDRIYGDGVNIAARLEGLAEPGGVCISGSAHEQIENKLALGYEYLGEHSVKNIAKPVKVYKVPMVATNVTSKKEKKKSKLKKQSNALGATEGIGGTGLQQIFSWVTVIILTAIIVGTAIWNLRTPEPHQVIRLYHDLPSGQQLNKPSDASALAVSPDGKQCVYSTVGGLYLRSVDELNAKLISGTENNPLMPFFSSDGKWLGYWTPHDNQLKKISVNGGAPLILCETGNVFSGASWHEDNTIVYGQLSGDIMRISGDGGTPESIASGSEMVAWPQLLPGEKAVIYTDISTQPARIKVHSLESGKSRELFPGNRAMYLPTGHLIYNLVNNSIFAVPFDLDKLKTTGGQVPLEESVLEFIVSNSGTLVYAPGTSVSGSASLRTLVWVDKEGNEEQIEAEPNMYRIPNISPDGTKVALSVNKSGNEDIWIYNLTDKILEKLTFHDSSDMCPLWTHDGKRIIFRSDREEPGIYSKAADGTGEAEQIAIEKGQFFLPYSLSDDGNTLVVQDTIGLSGIDIGMLSMDDAQTYKLLLQEDHLEGHPQVSPDGKWIAYCSDELGQVQIFVKPFPDVNGGKWLISTDTGNSPLWSPDGRELFYLIGSTTTEAVMRVAVQTEPTFKKGTPEELFRGTYAGFYPADFPWDIHPDGNRFLMIKTAEATLGQQAKIIIVTNWIEELKKRVPVD
ncbi:adenylate/guanylate cyclase domain-containing protein [Thermodesulfobacteriota bacterium]